MADQIITDCGNFTLDLKQHGFCVSPLFVQTLGPWFQNEMPNVLSSEKRTLDHWATVQFPFMGTRTASPRGRYGERPQRDSVWRYICKNTTCWPVTAHDVTTGVPQYKCRRENTSSAFSSSLTGLFEVCNLVRVQFSLYQMASTSKAFKIVCG